MENFPQGKVVIPGLLDGNKRIDAALLYVVNKHSWEGRHGSFGNDELSNGYF